MSFETLLKAAETAVYRAKREGKDRVYVAETARIAEIYLAQWSNRTVEGQLDDRQKAR